jgi:outer membrane protein OmpA-like peptidoglycan-associated protein
LDSSARPVVTTAAWTIRGHHPATVSVTGCTDAIGNAAAGRRLPPQRAETVIQTLRAQLDGTAIRYRSPRAGRPARRQLNGYGKALNRRVVITFG